MRVDVTPILTLLPSQSNPSKVLTKHLCWDRSQENGLSLSAGGSFSKSFAMRVHSARKCSSACWHLARIGFHLSITPSTPSSNPNSPRKNLRTGQRSAQSARLDTRHRTYTVVTRCCSSKVCTKSYIVSGTASSDSMMFSVQERRGTRCCLVMMRTV